MATWTLTIPDAKESRALNAVAEKYGYTGVDERGNPQTKKQFTKNLIKQWLYQAMIDTEGQKAANDAKSSKIAEIIADVSID